MDKQCAIEIREHSLKAVSEIGLAAYTCVGRCSDEDLKKMQAGAGHAASRVDALLMEVIYRAFPELDHRPILAASWDSRAQ
jgi:hypothetical protein